MDNNNVNPTGNKGVFPGSMPPVQNTGPQNTAPQAPQQNIQHNGPQNTAPQPQPQPQAPTQEVVNTDTETYFRLENKNVEGQVSSIIEIDLISYRERGVESRYISINTFGRNQQNEQSDTAIAIDNEADFNRFKEFISKLNWND